MAELLIVVTVLCLVLGVGAGVQEWWGRRQQRRQAEDWCGEGNTRW